MDLLPQALCLPFGDGVAEEGGGTSGLLYIGSPGFLANFWQMTFSVRGRELGKVKMTA
jgi:hypothetical protein